MVADGGLQRKLVESYIWNFLSHGHEISFFSNGALKSIKTARCARDHSRNPIVELLALFLYPQSNTAQFHKRACSRFLSPDKHHPPTLP